MVCSRDAASLNPMLVLIADKFPERGRQAIESLANVEYRPELASDALPEALRETRAAILVVRSTMVSKPCFEASHSLGLVIRAGAGVNTIDITSASRRGVYVANCPGKNAIAVAELAMGLVLSLDRHIPDAVSTMRAGLWNKKRFAKAQGLYGRTFGLVGFGAIAREVARRARAFGLKVLAYDPFLDTETAAAHEVQVAHTLDAVLRESDIVSVHVPHGKTTHHLLGTHELSLMKPGALLIHTARGGVIDDAALLAAVRDGRIRAGLDVLEHEPEAAEAPLLSELAKADGVYATPHIGASTEQAESAIADEVVRIVRDYIQRGLVHHTVNVIKDRPARWTLVVRHLDRVGVLAGVLAALREEQLNVQEMQNVVFEGNEAASATITLEQSPSSELLERLRMHGDILAVELRAVA